MEQGGGEGRGREEGGYLCQASVSLWVCMHAMTHQESFFQGQAFTFPALKACWKITHTFSMKSLTITGKQTQRQLVGSVTPRPFNLSASHWENPWKEGKDSAVFIFKKKGGKERDEKRHQNKEKLYGWRQLLLLLPAPKDKRGPWPTRMNERVVMSSGWPGRCSWENMISFVEGDARHFPTSSKSV